VHFVTQFIIYCFPYFLLSCYRLFDEIKNIYNSPTLILTLNYTVTFLNAMDTHIFAPHIPHIHTHTCPHTHTFITYACIHTPVHIRPLTHAYTHDCIRTNVIVSIYSLYSHFLWIKGCSVSSRQRSCLKYLFIRIIDHNDVFALCFSLSAADKTYYCCHCFQLPSILLLLPFEGQYFLRRFFFYEPFPAMYVYNSKLLIWINQVHFWPHSLSVSDSY